MTLRVPCQVDSWHKGDLSLLTDSVVMAAFPGWQTPYRHVDD